jgi:putative SOS response-associated peptidase YedK
MEAHEADVFDESYLEPSYNAAPQTMQPVIRLDRDTGRRQLTAMRRGLIPFWSKDAKIGYSTINAKAETIATNPTFREAMKRRRCLVPADWFYEWQKIDAKTRQPFALTMKDGSSFAFAGLGETWKDTASGQRLESYTITDPNELVKPEADPAL